MFDDTMADTGRIDTHVLLLRNSNLTRYWKGGACTVVETSIGWLVTALVQRLIIPIILPPLEGVPSKTLRHIDRKEAKFRHWSSKDSVLRFHVDDTNDFIGTRECLDDTT